ncbi:MAG: HD domain-containing protein [bacterium]|nr:HD domain-containing protein [bacterium]
MTFTIIPIIAGLISLGIGLFVFIKEPKKKPNRIFFLLGLSLVVWNLASLGVYCASSDKDAILWIKLFYIGLVFIPSLFFHFVLTVLDDHSLLNRRIYSLGYGLSYLSLLFAGTGFLGQDITYIGDYYYPTLGKTGNIFLIFILSLGGYSCYLLIRRGLRAVNLVEKQQLGYFLSGGLILFAGIATNLLCSLGIWVYPSGHAATIIYSFITSYAIIEHRLIGVEISGLVFYKRKFLYFLANTMPIIIIFILSIEIERLFRKFTGNNSSSLSIAVIMIVALCLNWGRQQLQIFINQYLFRQSSCQWHPIKGISNQIASIFDKNVLMNTLLNAVANLVCTDKAAILLLDGERQEYFIGLGLGINLIKKKTLRFKKDEGLVLYLTDKKKILLKKEVSRSKLQNNSWREIKRDMEKIEGMACIPLLNEKELSGILVLGEKFSGEVYRDEDVRILSILGTKASMALKNICYYQECIKNLTDIIFSLIVVLESKDRYFHDHSKRVASYASSIAQELGLDKEAVAAAGTAGFLHDLGNIGVSEQILQKTTRLNKGEFRHVKQHVIIGTKIIESMCLDLEIVDGIRYHHERLDGSGYPFNLSGKDIPLISRILAVVDVFDAMVTDRPYRKAFSLENALIELRNSGNGSGSGGCELDSKVVDALIHVLEKDYLIKKRMKKQKGGTKEC